MITRQGWLVTAGSAALIAAGRVIGVPELFALGTVGAVLVIASLVLVVTSRPDLDVTRHVHPTRIHVGGASRVEVRVRNRGRTRTAVLRLRDPVSRTRGAELLLPRLGPSETATAAYRLPTSRRGLLEVGPLEVVVTDPFGLTRTTTVAAPALDVTVYPHVDPVAPLPYTRGQDPLDGARRPNSLGATGEDFYALRPYVVGDDLRRVHWPSTARHDALMVRQHEQPWQARTTVLLDVRAAAYPVDALELAVSAAASVVAATARRHDLVRLTTTAGVDSGFGASTEHAEAIMEHLAVVGPSTDGTLRHVVELLARRSTGGSVVAVLGDAPDADLRAVAGLRARFGRVVVLQVHRSAWDPSAPEPAPEPGVAHLTGATSFPEAWRQLLERARATVHPGART